MLLGKVLLKRYKVIEEIGSGAFGNTYIAVDKAFPGEPRLVVKHLCPNNSELENLKIATRLFETEANVLSILGENDQLKYVLGRMVNAQYEQRFPDAAEALQAFVPTVIEPSEDKLISSETATKQPQSKRKLLLSLLGIIGIAGVGMMGFTLVNKPNYAQLETYLQNKQWQQADAETDKLKKQEN